MSILLLRIPHIVYRRKPLCGQPQNSRVWRANKVWTYNPKGRSQEVSLPWPQCSVLTHHDRETASSCSECFSPAFIHSCSLPQCGLCPHHMWGLLTTAPFPSRDCRGLSWTPWQGTLFNLQNITTGNKLKRGRLYFSSCGCGPSCWGRHSSRSLRESVTLYLQSGCRKKLAFSLLSSSGLQPVQWPHLDLECSSYLS